MSSEPTDPFDVVRRLYRAINAADLDEIGRVYADNALAEQVFDKTFVVEGRDAIVEKYRELLAGWTGRVDLRMVGGIQTGWGWAQADWIEGKGDGSIFIPHRAGHSHFLIEDGRIRRHRRVITAKGPDAIQKLRPQTDAISRRYPSRPITGIGAVILTDGGVVLVKRRHEPLAGHWTIPGGTLDLGETLESATAREALEETGLVVDVGPVVDVFDRILLDDEGKVRYHFVLVDYLCRPVGGTLQAGSDAADVVVAKPGDLGQYHLAAKAADIIRKAFDMKGFT